LEKQNQGNGKATEYIGVQQELKNWVESKVIEQEMARRLHSDLK
jgi:hypothetical protein